MIAIQSFKSLLSTKSKLAIVLILVILPIIVLEIWSMNRLSTLGAETNKLEQTKSALKLENQLLENEISKKTALKTIEDISKEYGFEKVKNIEVLRVSSLALIR